MVLSFRLVTSNGQPKLIPHQVFMQTLLSKDHCLVYIRVDEPSQQTREGAVLLANKHKPLRDVCRPMWPDGFHGKEVEEIRW